MSFKKPAELDSPSLQWDSFYGDGKHVQWWPRESIIRQLAKTKRDRNYHRGLDLGCGIGRNCWLMALSGIEAYGIDISTIAIERARNRVLNGEFSAVLQVYDGKKIPFDDGMFDLVVADGVLDHMIFDNARSLTREIHRVLRCEGEMLLTLASTRDDSFSVLPSCSLRTCVIDDGPERGLIQRFFNLADLKALP
jgi:SAM-dependent methyltransferase